MPKKNRVLTRKKEAEKGTLLLGNNKNNVIVSCLLSYFLCLGFLD